jgi:hypothetical protein
MFYSALPSIAGVGEPSSLRPFDANCSLIWINVTSQCVTILRCAWGQLS